jgi:hypothetical protein
MRVQAEPERGVTIIKQGRGKEGLSILSFVFKRNIYGFEQLILHAEQNIFFVIRRKDRIPPQVALHVTIGCPQTQIPKRGDMDLPGIKNQVAITTRIIGTRLDPAKPVTQPVREAPKSLKPQGAVHPGSLIRASPAQSVFNMQAKRLRIILGLKAVDMVLGSALNLVGQIIKGEQRSSFQDIIDKLKSFLVPFGNFHQDFLVVALERETAKFEFAFGTASVMAILAQFGKRVDAVAQINASLISLEEKTVFFTLKSECHQFCPARASKKEIDPFGSLVLEAPYTGDLYLSHLARAFSRETDEPDLSRQPLVEISLAALQGNHIGRCEARRSYPIFFEVLDLCP